MPLGLTLGSAVYDTAAGNLFPGMPGQYITADNSGGGAGIAATLMYTGPRASIPAGGDYMPLGTLGQGDYGTAGYTSPGGYATGGYTSPGATGTATPKIYYFATAPATGAQQTVTAVPTSVDVTPAATPAFSPVQTPVPTSVQVTPGSFGTPVPTSVQVTPGYFQTPGQASTTDIINATNAGMTVADWQALSPSQQAAIEQSLAAPIASTPVGSTFPRGGGGGSSGGGGGGAPKPSGGAQPPAQQPATQPRTQPLISFGLTAGQAVPLVAPKPTAQQIAGTGLSAAQFAALSPAQQISALQNAGNVVGPSGAVISPAQVNLLAQAGYTAAQISAMTPAQKATAVQQAAARLSTAQQAQISGYTQAQWAAMTPQQQAAALTQSGLLDSQSVGLAGISPMVLIIGGVILLVLLSQKGSDNA